MRPKDRQLAKTIATELSVFEKRTPLPGIKNPKTREVFIEQIIESLRRVKYVSVLQTRKISELRMDPTSDLFDPVRAAILCQRNGDIEEAFWFVFLFIHFGKSGKSGWRLARDIYGGLGKVTWDWKTVSTNPKAFRKWLEKNQAILRGSDGIPRSFGNHRKYESLKASTTTGTGAVVESYVEWVARLNTHDDLVKDALKNCENDPKRAFNYLYLSMAPVIRFGRTARFDYLAMLGKLGLACIVPDATYMNGATGPLTGARLLFSGNSKIKLSPRELEDRLAILGPAIEVGMQAMEDALCNWQKSPAKFTGFRA